MKSPSAATSALNVSWYDAVEFANFSSESLGLTPVYRIERDRPDPANENPYDDVKCTVSADGTADEFRLPTEVEWEYAAGGGPDGTGLRFAGSDDLDAVGWYAENSGGRAHGVGQKRPNELGVVDLSGNVWEWCGDWYADHPDDSGADPVGPPSGTFRVVRGGSWYVGDDLCLVENRNFANPHIKHHAYGLRLAQRA